MPPPTYFLKLSHSVQLKKNRSSYDWTNLPQGAVIWQPRCPHEQNKLSWHTNNVKPQDRFKMTWQLTLPVSDDLGCLWKFLTIVWSVGAHYLWEKLPELSGRISTETSSGWNPPWDYISRIFRSHSLFLFTFEIQFLYFPFIFPIKVQAWRIS